jgi:hypothetical protein
VSAPSSCLRCGDFGTIFAPGVPVCSRCLTDERTASDAIWVRAPFTWRRYWPLAAVTAVGALAVPVATLGPLLTGGVFLPLTIAATVTGALMGGVFALFFTYFFVYPWLHVGMSHVRRELEKTLGLTHIPRESAFFALHIFPRWKPGMLRLPAEFGILVEVEGGLVFFGAQGTRSAYTLEQVASVVTTWQWRVFPPRTALSLALKDGTTCFFRLGDGPTRAADRSNTLALAGRLEARRRETT